MIYYRGGDMDVACRAALHCFQGVALKLLRMYLSPTKDFCLPCGVYSSPMKSKEMSMQKTFEN